MRNNTYTVILYDQVNSKRIHEVTVYCSSERNAKILGQAEFIKAALNIDKFETVVIEQPHD